MDVQVGQVFRDTYYDKKNPELTHRTIVVRQILPNGVMAETLTDTRGRALGKGRRNTIMFKTLRAGYEPVAQTPIASAERQP